MDMGVQVSMHLMGKPDALQFTYPDGLLHYVDLVPYQKRLPDIHPAQCFLLSSYLQLQSLDFVTQFQQRILERVQ